MKKDTIPPLRFHSLPPKLQAELSSYPAKLGRGIATTAIDQDGLSEAYRPVTKGKCIVNLMGEPVIITTADGHFGPLPADGKIVAEIQASNPDYFGAHYRALRSIIGGTFTLTQRQLGLYVGPDDDLQGHFPQPRRGVYLLIPADKIAYVAMTGRVLDDIIFPAAQARDENGYLVISETAKF